MNQPVPKRRRRTEPASVVGSGSLLPDDVLFFHILALLPVKCLVRLQSVCKLWKAIITSSYFVRRQLEICKSRPPSMLLVPRKYQEDLNYGTRFVNMYTFQPGHSKVAELIFQKNFSPSGIAMFSIPLHCDGLILIPCMTGQIYMCNPSTKEFVELPPGSQTILLGNRVGFGFDPRSGTYKVARHFLRSVTRIGGIATEFNSGHEILTLGDGKETWKWKATVDPPYPIKATTPICLPGFFYWSALQSVAGHGKVKSDVILRFSLFDETFTVHPNPPCRGFLGDNDVLSELCGKLCYVYSGSFWELDIWLAEDGPILTWSLCRRIRLPLPLNSFVLPCASADQDKIFLSVDACFLLKCNLCDGTIEEFVNLRNDVVYDQMNGTKFTTGALTLAHYMVPVVESLLRIRPLQC